jgi:hypothetical protein
MTQGISQMLRRKSVAENCIHGEDKVVATKGAIPSGKSASGRVVSLTHRRIDMIELQLLECLERIESKLDEIAGLRSAKEWLTTAEVAEIVGNLAVLGGRAQARSHAHAYQRPG